MGLLFRKQVHNSLFAQFCPNFWMLRNCYKSASQSFYGYFPNTRTVFLWKRSYRLFSEKEALILFFSPTNEREAMIFLCFFYQPIRKKLVYCFFTNQCGKNSHCAVQSKSWPRRALQNNLFNSHSVSVGQYVEGDHIWYHLISFHIIDNDDADNEYPGIPTWLGGSVL